jgi:hypothetical protein
MRLKNAALFAVGFLSVSFWLHGSARCESSLAPPLSLAPPPPAIDKGSPPPATTNNNVWPPLATPNVSPPRATAKGSPPPATNNVWPPMATDVPPPTATTKRSAPTATAKDTLPTATAKEARPPAIDNVSPTPKPAADYDGFTVGIVDDEGTSGQTSPAVRSRPAQQPKLRQQPDSIEGPWARQQSVDQAEDEKLKRKLTICRGCKG